MHATWGDLQLAVRLHHRSSVAKKQKATFQARLHTFQRSSQKLQAQVQKLQQVLKEGRLQLQHEVDRGHQALEAAAQAERRAARAESVVGKLEERKSVCWNVLSALTAVKVHACLCGPCRHALEAERRVLGSKLSAALSQIAAMEKRMVSMQRSEAVLRQALGKANRVGSQLSAAESRAATLLEALEGAEAALRASQAQSTRLLQVV